MANVNAAGAAPVPDSVIAVGVFSASVTLCALALGVTFSVIEPEATCAGAAASVAVAVNGNVPDCNGPGALVRAPALVRETPAGSNPPVMAHASGPTPPAAVTVA